MNILEKIFLIRYISYLIASIFFPHLSNTKNGCNERKPIFKCTNVPFENFFQECQSKNETNYEESIFLLNKDLCLAIST